MKLFGLVCACVYWQEFDILEEKLYTELKKCKSQVEEITIRETSIYDKLFATGIIICDKNILILARNNWPQLSNFLVVSTGSILRYVVLKEWVLIDSNTIEAMVKWER